MLVMPFADDADADAGDTAHDFLRVLPEVTSLPSWLYLKEYKPRQ